MLRTDCGRATFRKDTDAEHRASFLAAPFSDRRQAAALVAIAWRMSTAS